MRGHQLLTVLYESKEVADVIKKLKPVHLQQDILQHTFLTMYEKPDAFIVDMHERGKLKAYIVKILYNTATYNKSAFAKEQGRETPTDFCDPCNFEFLKVDTEEQDRQEFQTELACATSEVHWYKMKVVELYAEHGTLQKVSDVTQIPLSSIYKTLRDTRKEIKQKL